MAGLMRALRGVATGYMGARVDMMAEKSKREREDEIRKAEEAFELNKLNDKYRLERALQIDLLEKKQGFLTEKELKEEKERLAKMRKQKGAEGFTEPMLDILELQGYLDSDAAFGVWFNRYDSKLPGMDWHLKSYTDPDSEKEITFQEGYINKWEEYIIKQGTAQGDGSAFSTENVVESLKNQNGVSENAAKIVTSSNKDIAAATSGQTVETKVEPFYKEGQIPGPIKGVDLSGPSLLKKETTDTQPSGKKTGSHWLTNFQEPNQPKEIRLYTNNDPNWDNFTDAPKNLNEGTELLLLTYDAPTGQYVAKKVTYADDFDAINAKIGEREKQIVDAIYSRKFLLSENKDLAALVAKGGPQAVKEFFAQNEKNKKLFNNLYDFATMLDATYHGYLNKGPYDIVKSSVNLNSATNFDKGREIKAEMLRLTNLNKTDADKAAVLLQGINDVYSWVRNATVGLDKDIPEQRNLITRIQEYSLSRLRQNFAFNMIPDEKSGMMATQSDEYKDGLRLFDTIMADIKLGENGNKGKYWITKENLEKGYEKIREETKFKAPFIGIDESIPVPETGGGTISGETTGTIPSSIKDGVTIYDLSAIQGKETPVIKISRISRQNAISTADSITVKDADDNDLVLTIGDTVKIGNYTYQVSDEAIKAGMSDSLNLKQLPYTKQKKGNPNRVLLDSKIKQLNKEEEKQIPKRHTAGMTDEKWLKNHQTKITTLKQEIEELYNKIKG